MTRGGGPEQRGMSQVARWLPASSELDFGRYRSMRQLRRRKDHRENALQTRGSAAKGYATFDCQKCAIFGCH